LTKGDREARKTAPQGEGGTMARRSILLMAVAALAERTTTSSVPTRARTAWAEAAETTS
jgi:hypothetical protein